MVWAAEVCSRASFAQSGPVSSISLGRLFSVRVSETDPGPGTWLRSGRLTCCARTGFRAVTTATTTDESKTLLLVLLIGYRERLRL